MKTQIKKIAINILLASVLGSTTSIVLSGCNSGASNTVQQYTVKSNQLQAKGASIDEINTWWETVQAKAQADDYAAKAKTDFFAALDQNKISTFLTSQAQDLLLSGLKSLTNFGIDFAVSLLKNLIFPPQKSIEEIRYDNIMGQLKSMDNKLDTIKSINNMTFEAVVSNYAKDQNDIFSSNITEVNDIDGYFKNNLGQIKTEKSDYGQLYESGLLDLMTLKSDNKTYAVNKDAIKLLMYVATNSPNLFNNSLNKANMEKLDIAAIELSNLSDNAAYTTGSLKNNLLKSTQLGAIDHINLLPNLMSAVSNELVSKNSNAFNNTGKDSSQEPRYKYENLAKNSFLIDSSLNQFNTYLQFNDFTRTLQIKLIRQMMIIERLQYFSLALRYIGGNTNIAIPAAIDSKFNNTENIILNREKSKENTNSIALDRAKLFNDAAATLNASYKVRAEHINKLINEPKENTYGKLSFDVNVVGNDKDFVTSIWELIRGGGKYSAFDTNGKEKDQNSGFHAIKNPNQNDDPTPYYRYGSSIISLNQLINDGRIYWDGHYFKTFKYGNDNKAITTNPLIQNIGDMCNKQNGRYELELLNNKLLYCTANTFNLSSLNNPHMDSVDLEYSVNLFTNPKNLFRGGSSGGSDNTPFEIDTNGEFYYRSDDGSQIKTNNNQSAVQIQKTPSGSTWEWSYQACQSLPDGSCLYPTYSSGKSTYTRASVNNGNLRNLIGFNKTAYIPIHSVYGRLVLIIEAKDNNSLSLVGLAKSNADIYLSEQKYYQTYMQTYQNYADSGAEIMSTKQSNKTILIGYNPKEPIKMDGSKWHFQYADGKEVTYTPGEFSMTKNNKLELGGNYLSLQSDGNFVMYRYAPIMPTPMFAAGLFNVDHVVFQEDGNLVGYNGNKAVWASNTASDIRYASTRKAPRKLVMQHDGNLVIYDTQPPYNALCGGSNCMKKR